MWRVGPKTMTRSPHLGIDPRLLCGRYICACTALSPSMRQHEHGARRGERVPPMRWRPSVICCAPIISTWGVSFMSRVKNPKLGWAAVIAVVVSTLAGTVSATAQVNIVIDTINTHGSAAIVVDEVRGKVYAGGGPGLDVIDENSDKVVATVPLANSVFSGLAIDPLEGKVFSTNYVGAALSVVDEKTNKLAATVVLPAAGNSLGVAVDPILHRVYVSVEGTEAYVAVFDEDSDALIDTIKLDQYPQQIAVDLLRHNVYVEAGPAGPYEIYAISGLTNQVTATIPMPEAVETGLAIDPIRGLVYASGTGCTNVSDCAAPGVVFAINEATNEISHRIRIAPSAGAGNENVLTEMIAVDPVNHAAYAADFHYGTIAVIDTVTNKLKHTITIPGGKNSDAAVDPVRGKVYVSDVINNDVNVIAAVGPHLGE